MYPFKKGFVVFAALAVALIITGFALSAGQVPAAQAHAESLRGEFEWPVLQDGLLLPQQQTTDPSIDHSLFPVLNQEFATGPDVTRACLNCHSSAAQEVMATTHWTWEYTDPVTGEVLGKKHVINNYCIAVATNEPLCTSCHIGYGWTDKTFDFTAQENVDCLVCHDTTGTYKKFPTDAGHPAYVQKEFPAGVVWESVNLSNVAKKVGLTSRATCGSCHFFGGGDDAVKHGDLDTSLLNPTRELDVHMDAEGLNYNCTECHKSDGHVVPGTRYTMTMADRDSCDSCHTSTPHSNEMIDRHIARIACQTCHIPTYARGGQATQMYWDWSKAGEKNPDGSLKIVTNEDGDVTYDTRKGEMVWETNVVPEYIWFNGTVEYVALDDKIDPTQMVTLNKHLGERSEPEARIFPVKVFTAMQPYDSGNNTLVVPHLYGSDEAAYWETYDWNAAIAYGMEYVGAEYSGEYGFVETEMYWIESHMVAPAENSLVCQDCHTAEGGRLDFAALGYNETEVTRLTNFPPSLESIGGVPAQTPESCSACHPAAYDNWLASNHGEKFVGCVACHEPVVEGGVHPAVSMGVDRSEFTCGVCHLDHLDDWRYSKHAEIGMACAACHEPHTQAQRLAGDNSTSCENCHHKESGDVPHSTHTAAGLVCTDCHKYTNLSTGHNFQIGPDTCLHCHGEDIHTAASLVTNGGITNGVPYPNIEEPPSTEETSTLEESGVIGFPSWLGILLGVLVGVGGYWVVAGRNPGYEYETKPAEKAAAPEKKSEPETKSDTPAE